MLNIRWKWLKIKKTKIIFKCIHGRILLALSIITKMNKKNKNIYLIHTKYTHLSVTCRCRCFGIRLEKSQRSWKGIDCICFNVTIIHIHAYIYTYVLNEVLIKYTFLFSKFGPLSLYKADEYSHHYENKEEQKH